MALLWIEGFEGFGTTTGGPPRPTGALARKYINIVRESSMSIEAGRISGYCLRIWGNTDRLSTPVLTSNTTMTAGVAFRSDGGADYRILSFYDGAQEGMNIRLDYATGEMSIWRYNTRLDTTVGLNIQVDTWYYVELQVTCDSVAGAYEVRVGTNAVLSGSGVNTQAGGNAYHDRVKLYPASVGEFDWDDIYVCDSTGSDNNDFLGNCKVTAIFPDGDDTANWATSTPSANHWENVDENEADEDTSYVEEDTVNVTDLYDYGALPAGDASLFGIQINTECRETDANSFDIKLPVDSNGTQSDGAGLTIGTTDWVTKTRLVETDPDTGNLWTLSAVNAAKFGIKVG